MPTTPIPLGVLLVLLCVGCASAESTPLSEAAVATARAAQPRAQRLVERTLRQHPEVAHVVLHVTPPGKDDSANVIIASNIGRIGKLADADDLRIMHRGVAETVIAKSGDRFNVSLPLLDRAGLTIGVIAVGFHYRAGDDTARWSAAAERIRDQLRKKIPSAASLFAR